MSWKDKLPESTANYVQSIIDQIPEAMGARDAFVVALDQIAGSAKKPKFTHLIVDLTNDDTYATSNETYAREAAKIDENIVIVLATGDRLEEDGSLTNPMETP